MYIIQNQEEHIAYFRPIFNRTNNNIKIGKYIDEMECEDILNANEAYFYNFSEGFVSLPKNQINIIIFNYTDLDQVHVYIFPKKISKIIEINDKKTNFLYLEKDNEYTLNFQNNTIKRMIKLSRQFLKSEIIIEEGKDKFTLNSENLYYIINNKKGTIKLSIKNDDAIIEFLFMHENVYTVDCEMSEYLINYQYNLIKIPKKYKSKKFKFQLISKDIINLKVFYGYCKSSYYYYDDNQNSNELNFNKEGSIELDDLYKEDLFRKFRSKIIFYSKN